MNKKNRMIAFSLLLVLISIGLYFLFADNLSTNNSEKHNSLVTFDQVDMKESANGQVIWYLKAAHVKIDEDKDTAHLEGVQGYFKNDSGELTIDANKGTVHRKDKIVYLEGNIHGKTKDGAVLTAKNLTYDGKTQILSTNQSFIIDKDGKILTADTFTADRVLQEITAKGHASLKEKGD